MHPVDPRRDGSLPAIPTATDPCQPEIHPCVRGELVNADARDASEPHGTALRWTGAVPHGPERYQRIGVDVHRILNGGAA